LKILRPPAVKYLPRHLAEILQIIMLRVPHEIHRSQIVATLAMQYLQQTTIEE